MEQLRPPKSEILRALFWRSEILQLLYWLEGEGLGDAVDASLLERFLGIEAAVVGPYLDQLVAEGYLVAAGETYALSPHGRAEGADEFVASFADLTRPAHGECSADCWCHLSPDEAEACAAERIHPHPENR